MFLHYNQDRGHALENVVYFELLRRGYDVATGKVGNAEVDFIAAKQESVRGQIPRSELLADDKLYVQVTKSICPRTLS